MGARRHRDVFSEGPQRPAGPAGGNSVSAGRALRQALRIGSPRLALPQLVPRGTTHDPGLAGLSKRIETVMPHYRPGAGTLGVNGHAGSSPASDILHGPR